MKPLLRWTIGGNSHSCGWRVLKASVRLAQDLYDFDYVVCYNNVTEDQLKQLRSLGVDLVDQSAHEGLKKDGLFWKLVPPRLNRDTHEIFLDNDVLFWEQVPEVNQFLKTSAVLLYEGLHGLHGDYELPLGIHFNSGVFGLPPGFDFEDALQRSYIEDAAEGNRFQEQGLTGIALLEHGDYLVLPQCRIPIMESHFPYEAHRKNLSAVGYHFVGANRNDNLCFYRFLSEKRRLMI